MNQNSTPVYHEYIGTALGKNSEKIAEKWLASLKNVVNENLREIFPTEEYLDHIPGMIDEIGEIVASNEPGEELTNSLIERKAAQLGELRYKQSATVNQLLREYDLLSSVLEEFISEETQKFHADVSPQECLSLMAGVARVVRRILQSTVDSFVDKYMEKIEMQTEKIISFNRFVSHELKTPLQAAKLNIELLLDEKGIAGEDSKELIRIQGSISQASSLLTSIENLVEKSQGLDDSPVRQEIDLRALALDVKSQLNESIKEREIQVNISETLGTVVSDTSKLRLVFTNLLTNAIKYSDPNKQDSYITIKEKPDDSQGCCRIIFEDNGLGISTEVQNDVFDIRFRGHEHSEDGANISGHGIGLFLVRETMSELNGNISLSSSEHEWTTVELSIPRQRM